tara:strand:+ start:669 stop:998 length:330 start_codon:yes stop_codon:yes gene_type:complete
MAHYLLQASYTPKAWAALIENPEIRPELLRPRVQALGGDIEGRWLSYEDHDVVLLLDMPDEVSMAALWMASAAGPHIKSIKITPLMSWEDGLSAMTKAKLAVHAPPGES